MRRLDPGDERRVANRIRVDRLGPVLGDEAGDTVEAGVIDEEAGIDRPGIAGAQVGDLRLPDRIRRTGIWAPLLVFVYTLIVKRCILDGWPGWIYVLQRTAAEIMIALALIEHRLNGSR